MSQFLKTISDSAPLIKQLWHQDVMIGITSQDRFLAYLPSNDIDLKIRKGDKVPLQDAVLQAALEGEFTSLLVPQDAYGFPFFGISYPIHENNEVVGAIGVGMNIEHMDLNPDTIMPHLSLNRLLLDRLYIIAKYTQELNELSHKIIHNKKPDDQLLNETQKVASTFLSLSQFTYEQTSKLKSTIYHNIEK